MSPVRIYTAELSEFKRYLKNWQRLSHQSDRSSALSKLNGSASFILNSSVFIYKRSFISFHRRFLIFLIIFPCFIVRRFSKSIVEISEEKQNEHFAAQENEIKHEVLTNFFLDTTFFSSQICVFTNVKIRNVFGCVLKPVIAITRTIVLHSKKCSKSLVRTAIFSLLLIVSVDSISFENKLQYAHQFEMLVWTIPHRKNDSILCIVLSIEEEDLIFSFVTYENSIDTFCNSVN